MKFITLIRILKLGMIKTKKIKLKVVKSQNYCKKNYCITKIIMQIIETYLNNLDYTSLLTGVGLTLAVIFIVAPLMETKRSPKDSDTTFENPSTTSDNSSIASDNEFLASEKETSELAYVEYEPTKPIDYNAILKDAVNKAMQNATPKKPSSVLETVNLPEVPKHLLEKTSLMENWNNAVKDTLCNETIETVDMGETLNSVAEIPTNIVENGNLESTSPPLSSEAQKSLNRLNEIMNEAKDAEVEYIKIEQAANHISEMGKNVVKSMENIEWWNNAGFLASMLTVATGVFGYLWYSGKLNGTKIVQVVRNVKR